MNIAPFGMLARRAPGPGSASQPNPSSRGEVRSPEAVGYFLGATSAPARMLPSSVMGAPRCARTARSLASGMDHGRGRNDVRRGE